MLDILSDALSPAGDGETRGAAALRLRFAYSRQRDSGHE